jgi:hypothetical protein
MRIALCTRIQPQCAAVRVWGLGFFNAWIFKNDWMTVDVGGVEKGQKVGRRLRVVYGTVELGFRVWLRSIWPMTDCGWNIA